MIAVIGCQKSPLAICLQFTVLIKTAEIAKYGINSILSNLDSHTCIF